MPPQIGQNRVVDGFVIGLDVEISLSVNGERVVLLGTAGGPALMTEHRAGISTASAYDDRANLIALAKDADDLVHEVVDPAWVDSVVARLPAGSARPPGHT